jgi:hypothetical protein
LAVAVAGGLLTGCGKKGDPLPPLSRLPRAATDLAVRQQGGDLLFTVSYPSLTTSGTPLAGLAALEVLRLAEPLAAAAVPTPPDPRRFTPASAPAGRFGREELAAATQGGELHLRLPLARSPAPAREAHTYAVRFLAQGGERSAPSNLVTLVPTDPPPPPGGLAVEPRADGVEVRWEPAGEGVATYRVYRRRASERSYPAPLATLPAGETRYLDATARFGERYIYAVTAAGAAPTPAAAVPAAAGGPGAPTAAGAANAPAAEGAESALVAEREVDYRDRFPPEPPAGLVALTEVGQVRLSWQASAASDLAGYQIYRRELPAGPLVRLTGEPLAATTFLAGGLEPGAGYAFRVTAVDATGNESPPSIEVQAAAQ